MEPKGPTELEMNALEHAIEKARQTKTVCGVTRRGTGRGYEAREPIEVLAHPDLAVLADEIERLRGALEGIARLHETLWPRLKVSMSPVKEADNG